MNHLSALWAQIDLRAVLAGVIDVLLVALILHRVFRLIRGTRAAYMLFGLLAVGGIYLLAHQLSLTMVSWLLERVINYALLIAIIVFQADIRRGLDRVGRRLMPVFRGREQQDALESVVDCCYGLGERKIGALIVVEREQDLQDVAQHGCYLDARLSRELLFNIFTPWPDNLLHDGAVVVKGGRLVKAGCVLPLCHGRVDRSLGTRHRAGLGVTEETDALALVVSEQRGTVSLCRGGQLWRDLPRSELTRRLREELSRRQTAGGAAALRKWFGRLFGRGPSDSGSSQPSESLRMGRVTGGH